MRTSEQIDKIAPALAKAQAKLSNPKRNKTAKVKGKTKAGTFYEYEYTYASLDSILDDVRPVFAEFGLFVTQGVSGQQPPYTLVTRITHESGQWQEVDTPLPYSGSTDPQELGIALSYTRRYGLAPMLGVAPEEDTDAVTTKKGAGKGTPAEGAGENLDEPTRNRMTDIATVVQDYAKAGKIDKAKEEWESSDFRGNVDAKVFAWSLLPSSTRSAIKRLQASELIAKATA